MLLLFSFIVLLSLLKILFSKICYPLLLIKFVVRLTVIVLLFYVLPDISCCNNKNCNSVLIDFNN